jgi:hypothetical protein
MSGKKFTLDGLKNNSSINIAESKPKPEPKEQPRAAPAAEKPSRQQKKRSTSKKREPGRPTEPEKKPTIQTSIRLHPQLKGVAKRIAEIKGVEVYSVYNEMLADYLAKYKKKYPPFFDHFEVPDKKEL